MSEVRRTLHDPVFDAAGRFAERPAVIDGASALAYGELARRARRMAAGLRRRGVGPGARVAILDRGADAVAAILATLLLGAAYVPFDSRWPVRRRQELLDAVDPAAVVVSPHEPDAVPESVMAAALAATDAEVDPLETAPAPADPAYILFTSGTTGTPKGVVMSHAAARYFVDWACATFALRPDDRVAGVSSFTFDLSIFDIFAALSRGASLCLYDHRKVALAPDLARFLETQRISVIYTVPTTLALLVARGRLAQRDLGALRTVMFAGEPFPLASFERLRRALPPHVEYFNLYGPTETNVCTAYRVRGDETEAAGIPIGQPLPGTRLVPVHSEAAAIFGEGATELWVYGPGVMSGYWGEAPHASVVRDPANGDFGYRTGDVCRRDARGDWIFLGRSDGQIKVNGFRVSAEEVEAAIAAHPAVTQCAVIAAPLPGGTAQLVAFIVCPGLDDEAIANVRAELHAACRERLPNYMCPNQFVAVESLPTKVSGKVDRATLRERYRARHAPAATAP